MFADIAYILLVLFIIALCILVIAFGVAGFCRLGIIQQCTILVTPLLIRIPEPVLI